MVRIIAHAVGAHDVAGAHVVQRHILAVDRHFEAGRIIVRNSGEIEPLLGCAHLLEQKVLELLGRGQAALRVRRDVVGDLRPLQAETVGFLGQCDAVMRIGSLLDQEADPELTCNCAVQHVDEGLAEQAVAVVTVNIEAAAVDAVEEVDGRHVGIAASGSAGHDEVPALVTDVDTERGALVAERAIAQVCDAGGDERTAVGEKLLLRDRPRRHSRGDPSDDGRPPRCGWRRSH